MGCSSCEWRACGIGRRGAFGFSLLIVFSEHDGRSRIYGLGRADLRQMAPCWSCVGLPPFWFCRSCPDSAARRCALGNATDPGSVHPDSALRCNDPGSGRTCRTLPCSESAWKPVLARLGPETISAAFLANAADYYPG